MPITKQLSNNYKLDSNNKKVFQIEIDNNLSEYTIFDDYLPVAIPSMGLTLAGYGVDVYKPEYKTSLFPSKFDTNISENAPYISIENKDLEHNGDGNIYGMPQAAQKIQMICTTTKNTSVIYNFGLRNQGKIIPGIEDSIRRDIEQAILKINEIRLIDVAVTRDLNNGFDIVINYIDKDSNTKNLYKVQ